MKSQNKHRLNTKLILIALSLVTLTFASTHIVQALTDEEIMDQQSALEERIRENSAQLETLTSQANTLANAVAGFDAQIAVLQDQIQLNELKLAEIREQLDQTREELEKQKSILRQSLREHYTFGNVRTIELLAESDSFSDFFDQQEYLNRVRSTIQDSAKKVAELEKQLEAQEAEQTKLLEELQGQKNTLDIRRAEKNKLLQETRGQQALYDQKIKSDQAAYQKLQNILAARQHVISGGTGGYPYPNSCGNPYPDPWSAGYCPSHWSYIDRQCTSWAYWRRVSTGRDAGMYWHNARDWKTNAQADGYSVGQSPQVGAIGVVYDGGFPQNHVYVVEDVQSDGTVIASQYNSYAANNAWGMYSLVSKSPSQYSGDWFIY